MEAMDAAQHVIVAPVDEPVAWIDDDLLRATVERMYRERGKLSTVGPLE